MEEDSTISQMARTTKEIGSAIWCTEQDDSSIAREKIGKDNSEKESMKANFKNSWQRKDS